MKSDIASVLRKFKFLWIVRFWGTDYGRDKPQMFTGAHMGNMWQRQLVPPSFPSASLNFKASLTLRLGSWGQLGL